MHPGGCQARHARAARFQHFSELQDGDQKRPLQLIVDHPRSIVSGILPGGAQRIQVVLSEEPECEHRQGGGDERQHQSGREESRVHGVGDVLQAR